MEKRIVLIGAGSTSFGPSTFTDLYSSKVLEGSTIVLHDINREKLEIIYELLVAENKIKGNKFELEYTIDRKKALKDADFIISSIEIGNRFKLWRQDYEIPRKYGSTQILGECGGPGGSIHAFRIVPHVIDIVRDVNNICPNAFFINFSNPMSRVCLAIKRAAPNLKFVGLCHEINGLEAHLVNMFKKPLAEMKITTAGLNHFGFLLGLNDVKTGKDLMPEFNSRALDYFSKHKDRFDFSDLSIEVYKRFGWFCYGGDNHMGEYVQFAEEFTKTQDMIDWIDRTEKFGDHVHKRILKYYNRLKKGNYPKRGMLRKAQSGERAIPIIESILLNKNSHENAVNIPNNGIVDNLPQDLVLECSAIVNKDGIHGIKHGNIPKSIASILRIEASVQDVCVEAILKKSKELAIISLAIDPNVGSFHMAEKIFNEIRELQHDYLSYFK
ncbi:MAG: family 4 glycosyl hydrolase [Promethearchaeota archaeon]